MRYPVPEVSSQATLVDLLSSNRDAVQAYTGEGHPEPDTGKLRQAFGTAEALFDAIPDETVPVLVPYKEGAEKLLELQSGRSNLQLSSLQPYTVSISRGELNRLGDAVHPILNGAVLALQEGIFTMRHTRGFSFPLSLARAYVLRIAVFKWKEPLEKEELLWNTATPLLYGYGDDTPYSATPSPGLAGKSSVIRFPPTKL